MSEPVTKSVAQEQVFAEITVLLRKGPWPFHCMVESEMKFEPTTLKVNDGPPCWLLFGDIASIAGAGFGGPMEPPPPPPPLPPQPSRLIAPERTRTRVTTTELRRIAMSVPPFLIEPATHSPAFTFHECNRLLGQ